MKNKDDVIEEIKEQTAKKHNAASTEFKVLHDKKFLFFRKRVRQNIERSCLIKLTFNRWYFLGFNIYTKIDKDIKVNH